MISNVVFLLSLSGLELSAVLLWMNPTMPAAMVTALVAIIAVVSGAFALKAKPRSSRGEARRRKLAALLMKAIQTIG